MQILIQISLQQPSHSRAYKFVNSILKEYQTLLKEIVTDVSAKHLPLFQREKTLSTHGALCQSALFSKKVSEDTGPKAYMVRTESANRDHRQSTRLDSIGQSVPGTTEERKLM